MFSICHALIASTVITVLSFGFLQQWDEFKSWVRPEVYKAEDLGEFLLEQDKSMLPPLIDHNRERVRRGLAPAAICIYLSSPRCFYPYKDRPKVALCCP